MPVSPGEEVLAADITSRFRVGTQVEDTDGATFTTATVAFATCVAQLIAGRTYRIKFVTHIGLAAATTGDTANITIREDSAAGTELQGQANIPLGTSAAGNYAQIETDYTALATGPKTFVGTGQRAGGTGTLRREAAGIRPTILSVDYAYG